MAPTEKLMQRKRPLPSQHPASPPASTASTATPIDPLDQNRDGTRYRVALQEVLDCSQQASTPPCKRTQGEGRWNGDAESGCTIPRVRSGSVLQQQHPRHCLDRAREHTAARPTTTARLAETGLSRRAKRNRPCHDRNQTKVQAYASAKAYARADADPIAPRTRLAGREDNEINALDILHLNPETDCAGVA